MSEQLPPLLEVPHPDEIRRQLHEGVARNRALRKLLKLAEAAYEAEQHRARLDKLRQEGGPANA